jgi:hypothetical protein
MVLTLAARSKSCLATAMQTPWGRGVVSCSQNPSKVRRQNFVLKPKDLKDLDLYERIILKWILKSVLVNVDWIHQAEHSGGLFKNGNKSSDSVKSREFLDFLKCGCVYISPCFFLVALSISVFNQNV